MSFLRAFDVLLQAVDDLEDAAVQAVE